MIRLRRLWERMRRRVMTPWAMLFALMALILSLDSLPPWNPARDSWAAGIRDRVLQGGLARRNESRWGTNLVVVRRHEVGFEVLFPDEDSWGDAASALATAPESTVLFEFEASARYSGAWGLTRYEEVLSLEEGIDASSPGVKSWAAENLRVLRAVAVQALEQRRFITPEQADRMRERNSRYASTVWTGWVHNGVTLAALVVFVLSLGWIPRARRIFVERRAQRELARGRCPACGYSIVGLEGDYCPECGERVARYAG